MYATSSRQDLLRHFTTSKATIEELSTYTQNRFTQREADHEALFSLLDEAQTRRWEYYVDAAQQIGVYPLLKRYLIPFQFPIQKGISQSKVYRSATLQGKSTQDKQEATGLVLQAPEQLELTMYQSVAGKIPVLFVPHNQDFVSIIQALGYKNEPKSIPDSMGASIIKGINNWDRISKIKNVWSAAHLSSKWSQYFREFILPNKALYQDTLIVLSNKPYSGIEAAQLGLGEEEWLRQSLELRLEHECAHYFTLRYLGGMHSNMHDELIADYMGITKVLGYFRPDWFLSFIGLSGQTYKQGSRLENYLGKAGLSDSAFGTLQNILRAASKQIALFNTQIQSSNTLVERIAQLLCLSSLTLEEMASPGGKDRLIETYHPLLKMAQSSTHI